MRVYVINLPRSAGRRRATLRKLRRAGVGDIEVVAATDGSALPTAEVERATSSGRFKRADPNMVGCSLSHLKLHRRLAAGRAPAAVIVEDDCEPAPFFAAAIDSIGSTITGRTAVLLHAASLRGNIALRATPVYEFAEFNLYEPTDPHSLVSGLGYVATREASMGLAELDHPVCEPDRWGIFLELGLLDRVLVAHPPVATDALFSSTIGYEDSVVPRRWRNKVDALPGLRSWARRRRRRRASQISRVTFELDPSHAAA